jgi:hypothetical protein
MGSIAWSSGKILMGKGKSRVLRPVWKYIPPPYNILKPVTLFHAPVGAKHSGLNTPEATIQVIGQAKATIPHKILVDLGIKDIEVVGGKEIKFGSDGEKTDVGTRLKSTTSGLSINEEGDYVPDVDLQDRNVRKPKVKKESHHTSKDKTNKLTSMKGLK